MKNKKLLKLLYFVVPLVFYVTFAFVDGPVLFHDSSSYINMSEMREPFYPTLIALIRFLFNNNTNDNYLLGVVVFQAILFSYVIYNFITYINNEYKTKEYVNALCLLVFFGISILNRYVAKRGAMLTNNIMSEGIAYPMFILFIRYLLDYLNNKKTKSLIIASVLSFLLISTRKQMYVSLVLILIVIIYLGIINKEFKKGFIKIALVFLCIFGMCKLYDVTYIKLVYGTSTTHTNDNRFLTTMIFYTSDKEDANLIEDYKVKDIFIKIYDESNSKGYLKNSSKGSWFDRVTHFGDNYDNIQIYTMWPMMREAAIKEVGNDEILREKKVDEYNSEIISSLLPKVWPELIKTFFDSFLSGIIITVSAEKEIFIIPSIVLYLIYIGLLVYNLIKTKLSNVSLFGILVLLSILCNVGLVSLLIFNQTRYTIYNMPLFYIAIIVMLYNILVIKKKELN